jgi:hypothetical protein
MTETIISPEDELGSSSEEDYYEDDDILATISQRPNELYDFRSQTYNIEENFQTLTNFLFSHAMILDHNEQPIADYEIYCLYLERLVKMLMTDLNFATQMIYAVVDTTFNYSLDPVSKSMNQPASRKAFLRYMLGVQPDKPQMASITSEYEYDHLVAFYNNVPEHMQPAIADLVAVVVSNVYNPKIT